MSCTIESGYSLECRDLGGLKDLWISNWENNSTYTFFPDGSIQELPIVPYYLFALMLETASFEEQLESNLENGTTFWRQSLSVTFYKINQDLLNMVQTLVQGRFRIIFLDQNGEYRLFGLENPVIVSDSSIQSGKLMGELNGATVTFSTVSARPAPTMSKEVAESILYPVPLNFRLILDPRNEFRLGPLTSPGGNYDALIQQNPLFYSLFGTTGIAFPDGNILVNQSKDRLDDPLQPTPGFSNSILDETGPKFFQGILPFQSATELMFVFTNQPPGSYPYNFADSKGNMAVNAPVGVYHPDGAVLASLCADIEVNLITTDSYNVEIEIIRNHDAIESITPSKYAGSLNFLTITMNSSYDFPVIIDPLNPDRVTAILTPGIYTATVITEYNADQNYPKSIAQVIFEIF